MFTGYGMADFSFMPRYKIGQVITAIRANASWADPQVTYTYAKGKFNTQMTGVSRITYDYPDKPAFYAIIAPYYFLSDKVDICMDIIPGYYNQDVDSYSGFWDNERKHKTVLDDLLLSHGIKTVCLTGLATNFCVKFTAL